MVAHDDTLRGRCPIRYNRSMIPRAYRTERPAAPVDPLLATIQARVDALLPAFYADGDVSPTSMGSAGLVRDAEGRIAWDRIWTSFCDLALAGGPPHRGSLLRPATPAELAAQPDSANAVAAELMRAIRLVAGLDARHREPGWLAVPCESAAAAAWLALAITAENVSCRRRADGVELPLGPAFRFEKEVKNGVCALAKACHYWNGHLSFAQQTHAATLDPWEPATPADQERDPGGVAESAAIMAHTLAEAGLPVAAEVLGWVGLQCNDEVEAGWKLRVVASSGVMCRRELGMLYVAVGSHVAQWQCQRVMASSQEAWWGWELAKK